MSKRASVYLLLMTLSSLTTSFHCTTPVSISPSCVCVVGGLGACVCACMRVISWEKHSRQWPLKGQTLENEKLHLTQKNVCLVLQILKCCAQFEQLNSQPITWLQRHLQVWKVFVELFFRLYLGNVCLQESSGFFSRSESFFLSVQIKSKNMHVCGHSCTRLNGLCLYEQWKL